LDDQSQSGYDLSLASLAALDGWPYQAILNLLIANRRKFGADLKLRESYYLQTVDLADLT
jgi:hypothetical protein